MLSSQECVKLFLNLCQITNHSPWPPALTVYKLVLETERCEQHLSLRKQETLRDLRRSWKSNIDRDYKPGDQGAPRSEHVLAQNASIEDLEQVRETAILNSRRTYEAAVSCLPWYRSWHFRTVCGLVWCLKGWKELLKRR